ncbi:Nucleoside diphosphate kinase [Schistosoma japonicum]|nr:similar to GenBank Accession Number U61287 nucleoside diphosphate kinase in Columba livia [Schistosoma japonicum]KAH8858390.1 Nucleoside diphosphate kinase [Schistosoma japonicum]CAX72107.1 nucleoside-diphosphate kinase [Schistosoma japonicum]CAX72108.1 nucleoside-diphosphate kinase [Schistosoma japonicum]CAX72109.1 nucleoside-diphosphate kinase [Schistosoma japonicum]
MERTFIMVKPDGVQRGLVGEIIQRFERRGYKLIAVKMIHASEQLLQTHYEALKSLPFFTNLVAYMSSGPVVPMVFEGRKAVENGRTMLGATRPEASCPGSIRGDFCQDVGRNVVHGSDSVESANREINLWFSPQELCRYEQGINTWIHE